MPLTMLNTGDYGKVIGINGAQDFEKRLIALGFVKGSKLKVIGSSACGLIVEIKGTRVALNYGLAQMLQVQ